MQVRVFAPPRPPRQSLHRFSVDTHFSEDAIDDASCLENVDAVVTVRFQLFNARSTFKVVSRASRVSLTARVKHVLWCLLIDVEADVLGGTVGNLCSVHAYILQHIVNAVK
jgi:hypothetical protein